MKPQHPHESFLSFTISSSIRNANNDLSASQIQGNNSDSEFTVCLSRHIPSIRYRFVVDNYGAAGSTYSARRHLLDELYYSRMQYSRLGYPVEGTVSSASVSSIFMSFRVVELLS